jgi:hypothetical protein
MYSYIQKTITIIHYIFLIIFILSIFIPDKYLIYIIFLRPLTMIHWDFNNNQCFLTEVAYNYDDNYYPGISLFKYEKYKNFVKQLYNYNIYFDNYDSMTSIINNIFNICWLIVFIRALIYYRKDIVKDWLSIKKHIVSRFVCDSCKG